LSAGKRESRLGKLRRVEPQWPLDLGLGFLALQVDRGELHLDVGPVASGFFGSKATVASNLRNLPSTATPICLLTKRIELFGGIDLLGCLRGAAQGRTSSRREAEGPVSCLAEQGNHADEDLVTDPRNDA
jgi:hypothetical protein